MTPEVLYFILSLLEAMDKYIGVVDGNHIMEKQKGQVQIKICDDNGNIFIATLHNKILHQIYAKSYFLFLH